MSSYEDAIHISKRAVAKPTEAQKEAGNYKKHKLSYRGMTITIENPKGSKRSGKGGDGKVWSVTMPNHYGYVNGSEGHDGDHVDVYLGDTPSSETVYIVNQVDAETGKFDEHKCMLGYSSRSSAESAYKRAFSDGKGKDRMGSVVEMPIARFKDWVKSKDTKAPARTGYAGGGTVADILGQYGPQADFLRSEKDTRPFAQTLERGMVLPMSVSGYNSSTIPLLEMTSAGVKFNRDAIPTLAGGSGLGTLHDIKEGRSVTRDEIDSAAMDLGGAAMTGGVAMPKPRGAIGSGAMRETPNLPMDQASRLARAREMGFDVDTPMYHGSNGPWDGDGFVPSKGGNLGPGSYLSQEPRTASGYAERLQGGDSHLMDNGHVTPVYARGKLATSAEYDKYLDAAKADGFAAQSKVDEAHRRLKADGFTGIRGDNMGRVVNVFDPADIRSPNAAFDPSKRHSTNLLASNPEEGSALPVALQAGKGEQKGIRAYHGGQASDWRTGEPYSELNSANGPWSAFYSDNPNVSNKFAEGYTGGQAVFPVDIQLENPRVIDANGRPAREMQFTSDKLNWNAHNNKTGEIAKDADGFSELFPWSDDFKSAILDKNHDGVVLKNTADEGTIYIPTKRGTVKSATTGEVLYSNPKESASLPAVIQGSDRDQNNQPYDDVIMEIMNRYGLIPTLEALGVSLPTNRKTERD